MKEMDKEWTEALEKSIAHWERMVDKCKWLVESGYDFVIYELKYIIGEGHYGEDCQLCQMGMAISINKIYYCNGCPLDDIGNNCRCDDSPWDRVRKSITIKNFIENAEKYMLPALYSCREEK